MSDEPRKPGRPVKWTPTAREELLDKLQQYVDETEIPILAEFAYQNKVTRTQLYTFDELTYTIKLCMEKKESQLERKALERTIDHTMAIFSLKQLGWKDTQTIEHKGGIDLYSMTIEEREERIKELLKAREKSIN